jgi:hypothetical protein
MHINIMPVALVDRKDSQAPSVGAVLHVGPALIACSSRPSEVRV